MNSEFVLVLTTLPIDSDAEKFASHLVEEKLAACVSILPAMRSVYRWKDAIERAHEQQLIIKTTAECVSALQASIAKLHPYEVPEFLVVQLQGGSAAYRAWLAENSGPHAS